MPGTLAPPAPSIRTPAAVPARSPASAAAVFDPPPFRAHPLLRGGHAQTVGAVYFGGRAATPPGGTRSEVLALPDGDAVALHHDVPRGWRPGDPAAVLVHGLAGSHASHYMIRIARKLADRGVRAVRMDLRGAGSVAGHSRRPYHAGISADLRAVFDRVAALCPGSPLGVAGFSMGGNLVLKTLGEDPGGLPAGVAAAAAFNPAVDLAECCDSLTSPLQRLYDRKFARYLLEHVRTLHGGAAADRPPPELRRIREFDEAVTVPAWRFGTVERYYAEASSAPLVRDIAVPTLVVSSRDDPLIPARLFDTLDPGPNVTVHLTDRGGHLGYIAASGGPDPDRRWMDWRVVDWLCTHLGVGERVGRIAR